jgi:hypothetical protein
MQKVRQLSASHNDKESSYKFEEIIKQQNLLFLLDMHHLSLHPLACFQARSSDALNREGEKRKIGYRAIYVL